MAVILSVIIFAATAVIVASAPTLTEGQVPANIVIADQEKQQDFYRDKRSQYQYASPCAAAAASSSAITAATYPVNVSPYQSYGAPHSYYRMPHYRSAEFDAEPEIMSFSDTEHLMPEHMPMARYGYAVPASHAPASYGAPVSPANTGSAYGVFPNAKTGGCSVPVLLSCSPSVVQGYVVPSPPQHPYGDSYRVPAVEGMPQPDAQEHHGEPTVHDHLNPVHDQSHVIVHQ